MMVKLRIKAFLAQTIVLSTVLTLSAYQTQQPDPSQKVPDAPSATRPASPFPAGTRAAPVPQPNHPQPAKEVTPDVAPATPPPLDGTNVPPRLGPRTAGDDGREEFRIVTNVNFVTIPVTVKDNDGRLVDGLLRRDFVIYEDGVEQNVRLFTTDPFPLSVALVLDQGMSDTAMKRVNETLQGIVGAFSQYDEVALYAYDNNVRQVSDFTVAGDPLLASLRRSRSRGRTGGVQVVAGPMASGPTINGRPVEPSARTVITPVRETRALNDALLRAALDLSKRDKTRRRIIFVISDGKELDSSASYSEVLKVLLTNEIIIYSIGVDASAIPGYEKLSRIPLPRQGTGNLLPKYVSATGGEHYAEFTRAEIEKTYARVTEVARNQYTLGYMTRTTPATSYRTIEVRVKRAGLRVFARDGYYPLPRRPAP